MRVRLYEQRRELFIRSPQGTIASDPSDITMATTASDTAPATTSIVSKIPKSTAALASVMTLFGVALLAVFGTWTWKRRKARAKSSGMGRKVPLHRSSFAFADEKHVDLENVSIYMEQPEKPKQAFLIHTSSTRDTNAGWKPQVKFQPIRRQSHGEIDTSPPQPFSPPTSTTSSTRSYPLSVRNADEPPSAERVINKKRSIHKPPSMKLGSLDSAESRKVGSPPPAYGIANHIIVETDDGTPNSAAPLYLYQTGSSGLGTGHSTLSPGWYNTSAFSGPSTPLSFSNITVTTTTTIESDGGLPPPPLPSPARSESFNIPVILGTAPKSPTSPIEINPEAHDLPRMMTVVHTFEPTLSDELNIKVGDTVRMLEEYKDQWCLAQHIGSPDAPRGVVPRFCLQERKRIIPGPSI